VVSEGTTFTLDLALADEPADERDATPAKPLAPRPGGDAEHTILYVEDNPSNLRLVERVLARRGGVRLPSASEGELVQELARECRPDLILLDLHLPGIDGEEVPRRLRADQRTADVAVVMVSADVTPWHRERLLEAGAVEYPTKPLDVPRFLDVIDGILVAARP
jgi:CheY-like chemotaxis protein